MANPTPSVAHTPVSYAHLNAAHQSKRSKWESDFKKSVTIVAGKVAETILNDSFHHLALRLSNPYNRIPPKEFPSSFCYSLKLSPSKVTQLTNLFGDGAQMEPFKEWFTELSKPASSAEISLIDISYLQTFFDKIGTLAAEKLSINFMLHGHTPAFAGFKGKAEWTHVETNASIAEAPSVIHAQVWFDPSIALPAAAVPSPKAISNASLYQAHQTKRNQWKIAFETNGLAAATKIAERIVEDCCENLMQRMKNPLNRVPSEERPAYNNFHFELVPERLAYIKRLFNSADSLEPFNEWFTEFDHLKEIGAQSPDIAYFQSSLDHIASMAMEQIRKKFLGIDRLPLHAGIKCIVEWVPDYRDAESDKMNNTILVKTWYDASVSPKAKPAEK